MPVSPPAFSTASATAKEDRSGPVDTRLDTGPQIFTVINEGYMRIGLAWARQVRAICAVTPRFICADESSARFLGDHGFSCEIRLPPQSYSLSKKIVFAQSSFPTDAAAYVASLKMEAASDLLAKGRSVLFSDVDAIWLRNPLEDIGCHDADIVFQPASFPPEAKRAWGFAICTGFFHMRACDATQRLAECVRDNFDGSDQRTLNTILLRDYDISWSVRPEKWETCSIPGGWISPIHGACRKTGLTLTALPHAYYQRHGTTRKNCDHAIICHPNSPKDERHKFDAFRSLGIFLENGG